MFIVIQTLIFWYLFKIFVFLVYIMAVEQCVKLVTVASRKVSEIELIGMVLSKQFCCQGQPCLTSSINQVSKYLQLRSSENEYVQ